MRSVSRAANRYTGALAFSTSPAPSSFQLVKGVAAPGMGDIDGMFDRMKLGMKGSLFKRPGFKPRRRHMHRPGHPAIGGTARPLMLADSGLGDGVLDSIGSGAVSLVDAVNAKTDRLQNALYLIIGLSGISALAGTVQLLRRR